MAEKDIETLITQVENLGSTAAVLMFEGRHDDAQRLCRSMIAQGELLLALYQEDITVEEFDAHRQRLGEAKGGN